MKAGRPRKDPSRRSPHYVVRELFRLRVARGWTVRELAERSGWHANSIYKLEQGINGHGSLPMLCDLAEAMGYAVALVPMRPPGPALIAPPPELPLLEVSGIPHNPDAVIASIPQAANEQVDAQPRPGKHYRTVHVHTGEELTA